MRCSNMQVVSKIETVSTESAPSGELTQAYLQLRCKPIQAVVTRKDSPHSLGTITLAHTKSTQSIRQTFRSSKDPGIYMSPDEFDRKEPRQVSMIIIWECIHDPSGSTLESFVEGLLIAPVVDHDRVHERVAQRVGQFCIRGIEAIDKIKSEELAADTAVITLV